MRPKIVLRCEKNGKNNSKHEWILEAAEHLHNLSSHIGKNPNKKNNTG